MTLNSRTAAIAGLILLFASHTPTFAQGTVTPAPATAAPTAKKADRINGSVTAIDPTASTITILDKKTNVSTDITVTPKTKISKSSPIDFSKLAIGDLISASAKDYTPGATTITAGRINLLSPLAEDKKHAPKHAVEGSIVTLTPLAITTTDGTSVTVMTDAKTHFMESAAATFGDIAVGDHVQATVKIKGAATDAVAIQIAPPHQGKGKGKKNKVIG